MDTSLQSTHLTVDDRQQAMEIEHEAEEAEGHIHLPNPSLWPILLGMAILVAVTGLLFIPDNPWLTAFAAPFVLIGILGWALEDPMATPGQHGEAARHRRPTPPAQEILDHARAVVERTVTFISTPYSVHPVKVDIESDQGSEGVVLSMYGKVELETQRRELENELRTLDGVIDVKNFVVAEDEILNTANARLESMRTQGKLEGASNISLLVENFILHIYGDVSNPKMKFALERELIGIPGVRVVVNHIGLNKEIPGNLGKTSNKVGV